MIDPTPDQSRAFSQEQRLPEYGVIVVHTDYPGGTGLMSGAVFGRVAGANAAGE